MSRIAMIGFAVGVLMSSAAQAAVDIGKVTVEIGPHLLDKAKRQFYGDRDLRQLQHELKQRTESALQRAGHFKPGGAELDVIIEDAAPNHPTFEQQAQQPGLDSFRSVSIGGADITCSFEGRRHFVDYHWYETDLRNARYAGTWTDAERAFDGFADKLAQTAGR